MPLRPPYERISSIFRLNPWCLTIQENDNPRITHNLPYSSHRTPVLVCMLDMNDRINRFYGTNERLSQICHHPTIWWWWFHRHGCEWLISNPRSRLLSSVWVPLDPLVSKCFLGVSWPQWLLELPAGSHWDFFVLAITTFLPWLWGLPFPNGRVPQAPRGTGSLSVVKLVNTEGDVYPEYKLVRTRVIEQGVIHWWTHALEVLWIALSLWCCKNPSPPSLPNHRPPRFAHQHDIQWHDAFSPFCRSFHWSRIGISRRQPHRLPDTFPLPRPSHTQTFWKLRPSNRKHYRKFYRDPMGGLRDYGSHLSNYWCHWLSGNLLFLSLRVFLGPRWYLEEELVVLDSPAENVPGVIVSIAADLWPYWRLKLIKVKRTNQHLVLMSLVIKIFMTHSWCLCLSLHLRESAFVFRRGHLFIFEWVFRTLGIYSHAGFKGFFFGLRNYLMQNHKRQCWNCSAIDCSIHVSGQFCNYIILREKKHHYHWWNQWRAKYDFSVMRWHSFQ